jgi:hypothetical protein
MTQPFAAAWSLRERDSESAKKIARVWESDSESEIGKEVGEMQILSGRVINVGIKVGFACSAFEA